MRKINETIRVGILVFAGPDAGDVFGVLDLLRSASRFATEAPGARAHRYEVEVVSAEEGKRLLTEDHGLRLTAERTYRDLRGRFDTLIITPIGEGELEREHPELCAWLARTAPRTRRVVGLCTGSYPMAQAGLLDGRTATTHWMFCEELARQFPKAKIEPDPIYVRDGNIYTSAGAMAGMDLVLALIEEDFGSELARRVAQYYVMYLRRPGGQSQFSKFLDLLSAGQEPIRELQGWILDHPDADLSVEALAERAGMSERNFRRVFARETGLTPAKFVEQIRVETARRRLEETREGTEAIAAACGFASSEQMRCAFLRTLGIPPSAYRDRFSTSFRPLPQPAA